MKRVVIMRGLSGSGKSTFASEIACESEHAVIVSADHFFEIGLNREYHFDVMKLGKAHQACFRNFMEAVDDGVELIIVDNTNSSDMEISPYYLAGESFGYDVSILEIVCDAELAASRNSHGVPRGTIVKMAERMAKGSLPPWWKVNCRNAEHDPVDLVVDFSEI